MNLISIAFVLVKLGQADQVLQVLGDGPKLQDMSVDLLEISHLPLLHFCQLVTVLLYGLRMHVIAALLPFDDHIILFDLQIIHFEQVLYVHLGVVPLHGHFLKIFLGLLDLFLLLLELLALLLLILGCFYLKEVLFVLDAQFLLFDKLVRGLGVFKLALCGEELLFHDVDDVRRGAGVLRGSLGLEATACGCEATCPRRQCRRRWGVHNARKMRQD